MTKLVLFEPNCDERGTRDYRDLDGDGLSDLSHTDIMRSLSGGEADCVSLGEVASSKSAWNQLVSYAGDTLVIAAELPTTYDELNAIIDNQFNPGSKVRQALTSLGGEKITRHNIGEFRASISTILLEANHNSLVVNNQSRQKVLAYREAHRVLSSLMGEDSKVYVAAGNVRQDKDSDSHFNIFALVPGVRVPESEGRSLDNTLANYGSEAALGESITYRITETELLPVDDVGAAPIPLDVTVSSEHIEDTFSLIGSSVTVVRAARSQENQPPR